MEEIINLVINNGLGVACVVYFMWFNSTTMKEMTQALNSINARLSVIEEKVNSKEGE